ncbi:tyrosine-type recombinase/integrase [Elizabethkingia anophelis]|uniref:Integrase n=1 Tax=Elizabethkingia anophelis TaxID=1117645 RepID=A0AAU8UYH8_9FLAO|nr:tyrosine-type recombinase/integrase [Elizabethkingia anophelis]AQX02242.1 integrase [Elizabethkingia anophelis]OPB63763.1 integrase [Elizabethkingia anophelis]
MVINFFTNGAKDLKTIGIALSFDNNKYHFRSKLSIPYEQWDHDKQRPKNIYIKKYKILNLILDKIKIEIHNYCNAKHRVNKKISKRAISNIIQNASLFSEEQKFPENSLVAIMKEYIEIKKELICDSTYKRYMVFLNLILRFEGYKMKRYLIYNVNAEFTSEFFKFGKEELYCENTIYRTLHFVKTILNFAEAKGLSTSVKEITIKRKRKQQKVVALTEKEILKIYKTPIPPSLQSAKEWLIISCYTGQRFSDFMKFSTQNLIYIDGKVCVSFIQQKTKKEMLLPLHPIIIEIIKNNNNNFPNHIDIKTYNQNIKYIARIAGINDTLTTNKRLEHRSKNMMIEKWQSLTSHIGRRSFASIFYGRIPTPLLMQATGHSSEQMFLKYINLIDKQRALSLSQHFDKIYYEENTCEQNSIL